MFQYDDYDVMAFSEYSVMDESQNYEMYDSADFAVAYTVEDPNAPVAPPNRLSTLQKILLYGGAGLGALGAGGAAYLAYKTGKIGDTANLAKNLGMYNAALLDDNKWAAVKRALDEDEILEKMNSARNAAAKRLAKAAGGVAGGIVPAS